MTPTTSMLESSVVIEEINNTDSDEPPMITADNATFSVGTISAPHQVNSDPPTTDVVASVASASAVRPALHQENTDTLGLVANSLINTNIDAPTMISPVTAPPTNVDIATLPTDHPDGEILQLSVTAPDSLTVETAAPKQRKGKMKAPIDTLNLRRSNRSNKYDGFHVPMLSELHPRNPK